jgi:hypothetical protein
MAIRIDLFSIFQFLSSHKNITAAMPHQEREYRSKFMKLKVDFFIPHLLFFAGPKFRTVRIRET